jgi:isopenicillin N synthase-like dioxygenase
VRVNSSRNVPFDSATMPALPAVRLDNFHADHIPGISENPRDVVGAALQEHGFVAVIGHGIPTDLLEAAYDCARRFFDLPDDVKRRYARPDLSGQRGYTSFGVEHAKDHAAPDLKEFYQIGRDLPDGHPHRSKYGANVWPNVVPEFAGTFRRLYAELERVADVMLEACSRYIGEDRRLLPDAAIYGDSILRVIHYPPTPADVPAGSMRSAPHEDINLITLLCGATADGLQLQDRKGNWVPIHTSRDEIVVNCGDMLQNLTNGLLRSTTHRVVNPDVEVRSRRFSLPFFAHPRREVDLSPLQTCVERTGGMAVFPSIAAGDYLAQRLAEIGLAQM